MENLEMLLGLIEENFTIDVASMFGYNTLNQPMVKIAVCRMGYSIVDNGNGTFEVGVMGDEVFLTFPFVTAEDVVAIITNYSNKQLQLIMQDYNALKHGIIGTEITNGNIEKIKQSR